MATRLRSRSRFPVRSPRVPTTWEQITIPSTHGIAGGTTFIDITQQTIRLLDNTGGTIVRSIGEVAFFPGSGSASIDEAHIAVGMTVVTKDAVAAGALPDPFTDLEHDWYFWYSTHWHILLDAAQGSTNVLRVTWDLKTSRRLREGYRLVLLIEKDVTELGFQTRTSMRNLWKLRP